MLLHLSSKITFHVIHFQTSAHGVKFLPGRHSSNSSSDLLRAPSSADQLPLKPTNCNELHGDSESHVRSCPALQPDAALKITSRMHQGCEVRQGNTLLSRKRKGTFEFIADTLKFLTGGSAPMPCPAVSRLPGPSGPRGTDPPAGRAGAPSRSTSPGAASPLLGSAGHLTAAARSLPIVQRALNRGDILY